MTAIRLFTCIVLSLEEKLEAEMGHVPSKLEGHTSHDQMVGPVKGILEKHHLPWCDDFVSAFVLLPDENPRTLHDAFGYAFELRVDQVIEDIALVCSDDIQNWVNSRVPPRVAIREIDVEAKMVALRNARLQSNNARTEARMFRRLRGTDLL
jgi:hypothetical protein